MIGKSLFVSAVLGSILSCNPMTSGPIICTTEFRYGIGVTVVDSLSGAFGGAGATVIAQDGAYADTVSHAPGSSDDFPFGLAGERAGTYTVTVLKTGYDMWTRSGVTVTKNVCHVNGVAITAKIQPAKGL